MTAVYHTAPAGKKTIKYLTSRLDKGAATGDVGFYLSRMVQGTTHAHRRYQETKTVIVKVTKLVLASIKQSDIDSIPCCCTVSLAHIAPRLRVKELSENVRLVDVAPFPKVGLHQPQIAF